MAYHIEYDKVVTYEMEDYNYGLWEEWMGAVVENYPKIKQYTKELKNAERLHPSEMRESHQKLLANALKHRINNRDKKKGWMIFKDLIGEYKINVDELKIIEQRVAVLNRFANILNQDGIITQGDPNPAGAVLTDMEIEDITLESIENVVRESILIILYKKETKLSVGAIMGYLNKNYPSLRPQMKAISESVPAILNELRELGDEEVGKIVDTEFADKVIEVPEEIYTGKVTYYFPAGEYHPSTLYYELEDGSEKEISVNAIIGKMSHDKKAQKILEKIRPGGVDYPKSVAGEYYLVISNNPLDVITKSTGRKWAERSCENYRGQYSNGPFSDVKWGNCIAYIFKGGSTSEGWPHLYKKSELLGRTLLRWGLKDREEGNYGIGIERKVYPQTDVGWEFPMVTAIGMIVKDAGYMNYKRCITPYAYKGWSDTSPGGNKKITFEGLYLYGREISLEEALYGPEIAISGSPLISYSDLHRLSRHSVDLRIKRNLSQNPSIWQFPEVVGRLMRCEDEPIMRMLAGQVIAHPAALHQIGEWAVEQARGKGTKDYIFRFGDGLISCLLENPNLPDETYDMIFNAAWQVPSSSAEKREFVENYCLTPVCTLTDTSLNKLLDSWEVHPILMRWLLARDISILMAPKISEKTFLRLVDKLLEATSETDTSNPLPVGHRIYDKVKVLLNVLTIPYYKKEDWGFDARVTPPMGGIGAVDKLWYSQYSFDRQSTKSISKMFDYVVKTGSSMLPPELTLLFSCIRHQDVYDLLWDNRAKYDIPAKYFIQSQSSRKNKKKTIKHHFYDDDKFIITFDEMIEDDFFDYRDSLQRLSPYSHRPRMEVPPQIVAKLMSNDGKWGSMGATWGDINSSSGVREIGVEYICQWLGPDEAQQNQFEQILLSMCFGDGWNGKRLLPLPDEVKRPEAYLKLEATTHLAILSDAISKTPVGAKSPIGLSHNPNISKRLQKNILGMKRANINWPRMLNSYGWLDIFPLKGFAKNPNMSKASFKYLFSQRQLEGVGKNLASNPYTPMALLTGARKGGISNSLFIDHPVEVLSNPALSDGAFKALWNYTMKIITTEVDQDVDRLFHTFQGNYENLLHSVGSDGRKRVQSMLGNNPQWLQYWRGGTTKKGVFSAYNNQNMSDIGGIIEYLTFAEDKPSVLYKFSETETIKNEIFFIEKIEQRASNTLMKVFGSRWDWSEEDTAFSEYPFPEGAYFSTLELFDFIPEENRGGPVETYLCSYCKERGRNRISLTLEEMETHYRETHPHDDDEELLEIEYEKGERDAERWASPNIFYFTDIDPPQEVEALPDWRYSWSKVEMNKILKTYVNRNNPLNILRAWANKNIVIGSPQIGRREYATINPNTIFSVINSEGLWTPEIIDRALSIFLKNRGWLDMGGYHDISLTEKLLNVSIDYEQKNLEEYNLTPHSLQSLQSQILNQPDVPMWYLFKLYESSTNEEIIQKVKDLRMAMPEEFNEYVIKNINVHDVE